MSSQDIQPIPENYTKIYEEVLSSETKGHMIYLVSPPPSGAKRSENSEAEQFLNATEVAFLQLCRSKFPDVKCVMFECESVIYDGDEDHPSYQPRGFMACDEYYDADLKPHRPYPVREVYYGSLKETDYSYGTAIDYLHVIVIVIKK